MAESATSEPTSSATSPVDVSAFVQSYKIGPVLQARALRDQMDLARRNAERMYEQVYGMPTQPERKAEDDVIQVDSPTTTVTHNYPTPPANALGTLGKVALAGAIASGVGLPIGAGLALPAILTALTARPQTVIQQPQQPTTTTVIQQPATTTDSTLYDLRLGKPAE